MFNLFGKKQEFIPATILVVEDSDLDRKLIQKSLEKNGYTVVIAVDGEEGLKAAQSQPIDLILLDYHMPGLNGVQVCERLKENAQTKDIPVIFLTVTEGSDIIQFYAAGAESYLHKLIKPKHLLKEIELMLEEARGKKVAR